MGESVWWERMAPKPLKMAPEPCWRTGLYLTVQTYFSCTAFQSTGRKGSDGRCPLQRQTVGKGESAVPRSPRGRPL